MKMPTEPSRPGLSPTVPMPRMRATAAPPSDEVEETSQRRSHLVELADVGRAGVPKVLGGDRADRHRHVGQRLVTPCRGDDDVAGVDRLLLRAWS